MNISPAIIIDVALIAVIVVSVFHYARKGFVAGLMDLVGNLASLAPGLGGIRQAFAHGV